MHLFFHRLFFYFWLYLLFRSFNDVSSLFITVYIYDCISIWLFVYSCILLYCLVFTFIILFYSSLLLFLIHSLYVFYFLFITSIHRLLFTVYYYDLTLDLNFSDLSYDHSSNKEYTAAEASRSEAKASFAFFWINILSLIFVCYICDLCLST